MASQQQLIGDIIDYLNRRTRAANMIDKESWRYADHPEYPGQGVLYVVVTNRSFPDEIRGKKTWPLIQHLTSGKMMGNDPRLDIGYKNPDKPEDQLQPWEGTSVALIGKMEWVGDAINKAEEWTAEELDRGYIINMTDYDDSGMSIQIDMS